MSWTSALVGAGIFGAIGYYEWRRLVHDTGLRGAPRTELYVSRGAGYWGPPVRFAAPSELTRVILRAGGSPPRVK